MIKRNRNIDQETSFIETLKERYFTSVVKSSMSSIKANNIVYTSLAAVLVELQMLFYIFDSRVRLFFPNNQLQKRWIHKNIASIISFILAAFNFPEYIFYFSYSSTLVIRIPLYFTISIVWIQVGIFIFSMSKHNTKETKNINLINYLDGLSRFLLGNVFYVPISNILTSLLSCSKKGDTKVWHHNQDLDCIQSPGVSIEALFSLLTFIVFLVLIVLQERFNFSRRIKN